MDAAPAMASLLLAHRRYLRFRAERGRILAHPSRWLPFADQWSNDMLDPERFLPQLSSETFLGAFMAASSSPCPSPFTTRFTRTGPEAGKTTSTSTSPSIPSLRASSLYCGLGFARITTG